MKGKALNFIIDTKYYFCIEYKKCCANYTFDYFCTNTQCTQKSISCTIIQEKEMAFSYHLMIEREKTRILIYSLIL